MTRARRRPTIPAAGDAGQGAGQIHAALADEAFERLYREQWSAVINYAGFRIGPTEAEDAAAEAFVRAWSHRADYDPRRGAPPKWLWGIVRNVVTDRQRRAAPTAIELPAAAASGVDVAAEVGAREELRRAADAIAGLAEVDQEIIALRFGAGLTNREIAVHLGRSEGNVALRLHRSFRKVREQLQRGSER